MQRRDQLKLTDEAKEAARSLVAAWDAHDLDQTFTIFHTMAGAQILQSRRTTSDKEAFSTPPLTTFEELARHSLIQLERTASNNYRVLLLQELRDAIQNDFVQYRDVPITVTGAIGTFINGSLTMAEGAVFSSSAYGDVTVTFQTLPDELLKLLGTDALRPEIASAITALKAADELTRMEKAGKVIEELGRGLGHLSNTGGALAAIALIARMLSGGGL